MFKEVPCVAGFIHDVVVAVEDGDREFVAAQIFPDVFDRIEFRSVRRQTHKGESPTHNVSGADHALASLRESNLTLAIMSHASALAIVASKSFAIGYTVRAIALTSLSAVPPDCTVVAEIGPRHAYAPAEAALLSDYLARGGRLLAMIDPEFPLQGGLGDLFGTLGLASDPAIVIDPLNHYGSDHDKVAVPYYPPHQITRRIALTIFPNARPIRVGAAPPGVNTTILASSSKDSYLRPVSRTPAATEPTGSGASHGAEVLAVAVEGRWPDGAADQTKPFRLVLVGNSNFAANSYFPYVSNGDLAVEMVRWKA